MIQQGQVFKLKARSADGEPLWAYRYRVAGRGSARLQVGGFGSRAEAQRALQNKLARQAIALEALDQLRPREDSPLLFPNSRGGHLDFRTFNRRQWKPAQRAVGIEPLRDLYDLRHTYATFALRAGVPVFALSRFMGTSIAMIDLHYGHLAVDSYQHAVSLLDALAIERAVDAGWTLARRPAKPHSDTASMPHRSRLSAGGRRSVDVKGPKPPLPALAEGPD